MRVGVPKEIKVEEYRIGLRDFVSRRCFRLFRLQWDGSAELTGSVLTTRLIVEHRNVWLDCNQSLAPPALA
jgi:hypothetical protein